MKHLIWVDIVRVLACFLVILIHSQKPIEGMDHSIVYAINTYVTSPCIPLFFILSGYLILPVSLPIKEFLKKRMTRILIPMFVWSVITFFIVDVCLDKIDFISGVLTIIKLPFCSIVSLYWFIYSLAGLYLFAPIISKWLANSSKKEIEYYLIIWIITLTLPFLNVFIPGIYAIDGNYFSLFYAFGGFLGYMIVGFYIKMYIMTVNKRQWIFLFSFLFITVSIQFLLFLLNRLYNIEIPVFSYLKIDVATMSVCIFLVIKNIYNTIPSVIQKWMSKIAPLTFGMYLIHILVMHYLVWPIVYSLNISLLAKLLLTSVFTFIFSYLAVKILSYLPYRKYIIG